MVQMTTNADAQAIDKNGFVLFELFTERAREWAKENVSEERHYLGNSVIVEKCYLLEIVKAMKESGLVVLQSGPISASASNSR